MPVSRYAGKSLELKMNIRVNGRFSWRQGWRRKLIRMLKAALNKPISVELCLGKISPCHASSSCG
jgi:hypothetical protein